MLVHTAWSTRTMNGPSGNIYHHQLIVGMDLLGSWQNPHVAVWPIGQEFLIGKKKKAGASETLSHILRKIKKNQAHPTSIILYQLSIPPLKNFVQTIASACKSLFFYLISQSSNNPSILVQFSLPSKVVLCCFIYTQSPFL